MRILIVDDEPNIRKTLRVALEAMGHAVEEAGGSADALKAIERRGSTWRSSTSGSAASRGSTCSETSCDGRRGWPS